MALNAKIRLVVVGLGSIGRRHARLLVERADVTVETVEPDKQVLGIARREFGELPNYDSFEAALETRPAIVWLSTPTPLHAAQTIAALEAGAHVFCEKPMSDSLENARAMQAAAEKSGKTLNIGFMLHFMPAMIRLRELVRQGALGNVLHVHARVGTYITLVNSTSRYQATQRGSLFLDYAHQPDIFFWLTGMAPKSVSVTGFRAGEIELSSNPNVAIIVCEYDSPLVATLHLNYVQMPQRHDYEIVGDRAWAALDFETGEIKIGWRESQSVTKEFYEYERDDLYRAQIEAFFAAVEGRRAPETSGSDGLISTAVCEAALRSYESGESVELDAKQRDFYE
ncbi:MAG TPA: Gfo/Idh/MocA family oxidoreductase [Pyrinomonadaceae bacterium]|jgi:predicted dehydrogenase